MVFGDQAREDQNGDDEQDQQWNQRTGFYNELSAQPSKNYRYRRAGVVNDVRQKPCEAHRSGDELFGNGKDRVTRSRAEQSKSTECENDGDSQRLAMFRTRAHTAHVSCCARGDHPGKINRHSNLNAVSQRRIKLADE